MSVFPRPVRPSRAIADLWGFMRARRRHEFVFGLLAVGISLMWIWMIFDKLNPPREYRPPEVQYVKVWPKGRTDAEIRAQQAIDAPKEKAAREALEAAKKARREQYRKLAERLGID